MAGDVKVFGALLTTKTGISITGDLGIDKDVDIVTGMLSVVGRFVQDTWGEDAEQIHLKDTVVSRLSGDHTQLIITSDGVSDIMIDNAKRLLNYIEDNFREQLRDWDGLEIPELIELFDERIESLKKNPGAPEHSAIPVPGFDLLEREDFVEHIDDIEDAFNGYHLLGDRDSALELAKAVIKKLEQADPGTDRSSLFYALSAKMMAEQRDVDKSRAAVELAIQKSEAQNNLVAKGEAYYVKALQHLFNNEPEQAMEVCRVAVNSIMQTGIERPRDFHRLIKYSMTAPWALDLMGRHDEGNKSWMDLLKLSESSPPGNTEMERAMLRKHRINLYNNLGYTMISKDMMDRKLYEEATQYYEKAFEIVKRTDARYCSPLVKLNLAQAYSFSQRWDEAETLLEEAMDESMSQKNNYRIHCVERVWGVYHLQKGIRNKDSDELFEAIFHFKKALKEQTEKPEIRTLNYFIKETEKALKELL